MVIFVCGALWRKHAMQAMWYSSPGFDSHLKALSLKGEDEKLILKPSALLEKFWRISPYVTDAAIAYLYM